MNLIDKKCVDCAIPITVDRAEWKLFEIERCDSCDEILVAKQEADRIEFLRQRKATATEKLRVTIDAFFSQACHARFLTTNIEHPSFNRRLWESIRDWSPTPEHPWLGLIGQTGECKTRIAWLLAKIQLRRSAEWFIDATSDRACLDLDSGDMASITDYELRDAALNRFSDSKETKMAAAAFLETAKRTKLLFYDDLGKVPLTPAVGAELFAIIDYRHSRNLTTIWTANAMPADFCKRLDPTIADPLKGRLLECSQIIRLK